MANLPPNEGNIKTLLAEVKNPLVMHSPHLILETLKQLSILWTHVTLAGLAVKFYALFVNLVGQYTIFVCTFTIT